ncbi:hypothetical protein BDW59DRAFT_162130 [Aspergillus cavernicola]|uniref:DUF2293 domain-containing protein n=1 Tax=Aspergillus cavernicola TaxID=176166 RepID=A0ABR4ICA4_9EURO
MSTINLHGLSLALRITHPNNMAPNPPKSGRKKVRRIQHRPRKHRIDKGSSPRSPRSSLAQRYARALGTQPRIAKPGSGGDILTVNPKPKPVEPKVSPRVVKYKIATQWPSSEPFEKNCLQTDPLPDDYVFVPRGNVYVTRNCRSKTKGSHQLVYKVYDNTGKKPVGIRIPAEIHAAVVQSAEETAESRANAVKLRDDKDLARSRQLLRKQFPLMPAESLEIVLHHAFLKGSGRVGRTSTTSDEHKAVLAVEAHIRHIHTPYESLLSAGKGREDARKAVWGMVQTIRAAWEGRSKGSTLLTMRNRI